MIKIFKSLFSHWIGVGEVLLESLRLYALALIPYFIVCSICFFFSILVGGMFDIIKITQIYFYDGIVCNFSAWRIHLAWFMFCIFVNIDILFKE